MNKLRFATLWFDGCSGCHMSILDMDERLLDLAAVLEVVYSPLVDAKQFPKNVDVTCVEGAISSPEDEALLRLVRQRTRLLIALGDCAVTGNVPAMRNVVNIRGTVIPAAPGADDRPAAPERQGPALASIRSCRSVHSGMSAQCRYVVYHPQGGERQEAS
jgi:Ni,Fe-hydrogenase III small subunit